ncbi:MAG: lipopolysaccharide kinase InaA family protein [Planctomycetota bacterium]|jgi:tRNA A-37 threonylcarbamoyl transferase component Bud32
MNEYEPGYENLRTESIPWDDEAELRSLCDDVIHLLPDRQVVALRCGPSGGRVFVKRYTLDSLRAALSVLLRGSPARREWNAMRRAAALGIRTTRPVALVERRRGLLASESIIATEELPGYRLRELWRRLEPDAERRGLARELGTFLRRVHEVGLRHGDLTCRNVFVHRTPEGWDLALIDLLAASFGRRVSWRSRAKDLYQLIKTLRRHGLGPGGRLRLLKSYVAGGEPSDRATLRILWRSVGSFFLRRLRKTERRG